MTFEPNVGQTDSRVHFIGRGKGLTVLLAGDAIGVELQARRHSRGDSTTASADGIVNIRLRETAVRTRTRKRRSTAKRGRRSKFGISRRIVGRRTARRYGEKITRRGDVTGEFAWSGTGQLRAQSNYFVGNDPRHWRTRVPHYATANAEDVLPGVGMKVYGNDEGVEYDLRVKPGVDPARLRLDFAGASETRVAGNGDLLLRVGRRELRMRDPQVYEELPARTPAGEANGERASRSRKIGSESANA